MLGGFFEYFLKKGMNGGRLAVLGATSGDTGSAAIAGLRGKEGGEAERGAKRRVKNTAVSVSGAITNSCHHANLPFAPRFARRVAPTLLFEVDCVILYPKGRVSEIQERQMTTIMDNNIHCVAVEGTFDDCQDIVKASFGNPKFRDEVKLGAVNSINWARVLAQQTYYFWTYLRLTDKDIPKVSASKPRTDMQRRYYRS